MIWGVSAIVLLLLSLKISRQQIPRVETYLFCAYGRVFVEFDEDGKLWGTLMLDHLGRPIPCSEEKEVRVDNTI